MQQVLEWRSGGVEVIGKPARRRGATMVEFVVVLPLFLVLLIASVEFCVLSSIRSTADNAAYEAARKLVVPGADVDTGIRESKRIMAVLGVRNMSVTVTPEILAADTQEVVVELSIPYDDNAILTPWFTGGVVVHSRAKLQTERQGGLSGSQAAVGRDRSGRGHAGGELF